MTERQDAVAEAARKMRSLLKSPLAGAVRGGIKSAILAHGSISEASLESAVKRVVGNIYGTLDTYMEPVITAARTKGYEAGVDAQIRGPLEEAKRIRDRLEAELAAAKGLLARAAAQGLIDAGLADAPVERVMQREIDKLNELLAAERAVTARLREALEFAELVLREEVVMSAESELSGLSSVPSKVAFRYMVKHGRTALDKAKHALAATPAAPCATCGGTGVQQTDMELRDSGIPKFKRGTFRGDPCPDCRPAAIAPKCEECGESETALIHLRRFKHGAMREPDHEFRPAAIAEEERT